MSGPEYQLLEKDAARSYGPWTPDAGDRVCQACGRSNPCWYTPHWNTIMDMWGQRKRILCPTCFMTLTQALDMDPVWTVEIRDE